MKDKLLLWDNPQQKHVQDKALCQNNFCFIILLMFGRSAAFIEYISLLFHLIPYNNVNYYSLCYEKIKIIIIIHTFCFSFEVRKKGRVEDMQPESYRNPLFRCLSSDHPLLNMTLICQPLHTFWCCFIASHRGYGITYDLVSLLQSSLN